MPHGTNPINNEICPLLFIRLTLIVSLQVVLFYIRNNRMYIILSLWITVAL